MTAPCARGRAVGAQLAFDLPCCVLPGCQNSVSSPGEPCTDCIEQFGEYLAHDPSALPLTAEQIAERDASVVEVLTSRRSVVVEVRRRGQICWLCVERRTCTQTPHGWECDRCRVVR